MEWTNPFNFKTRTFTFVLDFVVYYIAEDAPFHCRDRSETFILEDRNEDEKIKMRNLPTGNCMDHNENQNDNDLQLG